MKPQGEDGHLQAKEHQKSGSQPQESRGGNGVDSPSLPSERTKPADNLISTFHSSKFVLFTINLKRYMHPYVHSSIIYNSQDVKAT